MGTTSTASSAKGRWVTGIEDLKAVTGTPGVTRAFSRKRETAIEKMVMQEVAR